MKLILTMALAALCAGCTSKNTTAPLVQGDSRVVNAVGPSDSHTFHAIGPVLSMQDARPAPVQPDPGEVLFDFQEERAPTGTAYFALNSAEVEASEQPIIAGWVDYLKRSTRSAVLYGHACPLGEDAHNTDLGMRRALAVKAELTYAGIEPSRITVVSLGERSPATLSPEHFEKNRRVELEIVK